MLKNYVSYTWTRREAEEIVIPWISFQVIAILLIIGGVELNPGPYISKLTYHNMKECYKKRSSFASLTKMYEIKLAALLLARGLNSVETFHLASNMEAAGAFGDLVLKLGNCIIFMQIKNKENAQKSYQLPELFQEEGGFSLVQYYKTYCEFKQHWSLNMDLEFCDDIIFIVYTDAVVDICSESEIDNSDWHSSISSGGKCFRFAKNTFSLEYLDAGYEDFLSRFWLFTEQTAEDKLDYLIHRELCIALGTNTKFTQFLLGVQDWWKNSNFYLTSKIQFWRDIVENIVAEISQQKRNEMGTFGLSFSDDQHILVRTLLMFVPALHIIPKEESLVLSCLKVHNSLAQECHLLVDDEILQSRWCEILALWGKWCDVLIIVGEYNLEIEVLFDILHKSQNKNLIFINRNNLLPHYNCTVIHDHITLGQLDKASQTKVLASQINFQGYYVPFGSVVGNNHDLVPDDIILQLLTSELVLGKTLTSEMDFYVPRPLRRIRYQPALFQKVDTLEDIPDHGRPALIYADPGMGKSCLLTHLALNTKLSHPEIFLIHINLKNFSAQLETLPENLEMHHVIEFLLEVSGIALVWKPLFRCRLSNMNAVCVLFDGYDEISTTFGDRVIQMVSLLHRTEIQKLVVTLRSDMSEKFRFPVPFTLEPFTQIEQRNFLVTFWKITLSHVDESVVNNFASELLQLTTKNFSCIPLHLILLAKVFEDDLKEYSKTGSFKLSHNFDFLQLYNKYVDIKLHELYPTVNKELLKNKFMVAALSALLPSQDLKLLSISETEINEAKMFIMGLQEMSKNVLFLTHRVFAEYFTALWFAKNYRVLKNYMVSKFFNIEFQIICHFLDRILSQKFRLHTAVMNVNKVVVESLLLEQKSKINDTDEGGRTPLHLAVMNCNYLHGNNDSDVRQILEIILANGADCNIKDRVFYFRPLHLAERLGAWSAVDLLLGRQAVSNELILTMQNLKNEKYIEDILRVAAQQGYVNLISFLFKHGIDIKRFINVKHNRFPCKVTLLHVAAKHGQLKMVQLLVKYGIDIEARDSFYDRTVLMWAAEQEHLKVIEFLVQQGADINVCNAAGNNALLIAAECGRLDTVKWLIQHSADITVCEENGNNVLHCAAKSDNRDLVAYLLDIGFDIECSNNRNETPVYIAVEAGRLEVTQLLCGRGACLDKQNVIKYVPLHVSVHVHNLSVVQYLLEHGASPNVFDHNRRTPLHNAAMWGFADIVQCLVEHGASINLTDKNKRTPLHDGCIWGVMEVVQCLVEHGASLTGVERWGRTPLQEAARWNRLQVVEFLVDHGACVNLHNKRGLTPLHETARWNHMDVVEYLVQHGANVGAIDKKGRTPLDIATQKEMWNAVEFLRNHME